MKIFKNIAVLLSGGVDSSVALALLVERGYSVTAFYIKIWLEDDLAHLGKCPWEHDLVSVRAICEKLGVPLEIINLQKEYHDIILAYITQEVSAGRTPTPDVFCNTHIKFGAFFRVIQRKYSHIATGHYAQQDIDPVTGYTRLLAAQDPIKDQTYFLSRLTQEQVSRALFPIGHLTKAEVREQARLRGLSTYDRPDSQGLCFLGSIKYSDFLTHTMGVRAGDICEFETGKKLGTHNGFWFYTIGQRKGLGLPGGPWFVVAKDITYNRVLVSRNYYSPDKIRNRLAIKNCVWIAGRAPESGEYMLKLRHGPDIVSAEVTIDSDGSGAVVQLAEHDQGIAPGQSVVVYTSGNMRICLGSGIIEGAV